MLDIERLSPREGFVPTDFAGRDPELYIGRSGFALIPVRIRGDSPDAHQNSSGVEKQPAKADCGRRKKARASPEKRVLAGFRVAEDRQRLHTTAMYRFRGRSQAEQAPNERVDDAVGRGGEEEIGREGRSGLPYVLFTRVCHAPIRSFVVATTAINYPARL